MNALNSREIATVIWAVLLLGLWVVKGRKSLLGVLKAFFNVQILTPILAMVFYSAGVVWILYAVNFWTFGLLKETVIWFVVWAVAAAFSFATKDDDENFLRNVVAENIRVTVLFQFLVNTYAFSIPTEFVLLPITAFIVMLHTAAGLDKKYAPAEKLLALVQAAIGIAVLSYVTGRAISDFQNFASLDTLRLLVLAPILSVALVPFAYLLRAYVLYENLFINLKLGITKSAELKSYARRRFILQFGLNLKRLDAFSHSHGRKLMRVQTEDEVDALLEEAESPKIL